MSKSTIDRSLSGALAVLAEGFELHQHHGVIVSAVAAREFADLFRDCSHLATEMEDALASCRWGQSAAKIDLSSVGSGPDELVVDLSGLIGPGRSLVAAPPPSAGGA